MSKYKVEIDTAELTVNNPRFVCAADAVMLGVANPKDAAIAAGMEQESFERHLYALLLLALARKRVECFEEDHTAWNQLHPTA